MGEEQTQRDVETDRELIATAKRKGLLATVFAYTKLSGPGWLQSAITLGGGSLAGSLYLGVLAGFALLWLQPLAMILGIVMLSAIGYVALSTRQRPFEAINQHVNPVLGWGWAVATLMANLVWALPQFSLGTAAVRQNLLPGIFGQAVMGDLAAKLWVCGGILVICAVVVGFYESGSWGIKLFEVLLKVMVAVIVVSFFGVVVRMGLKGVLDWKGIGAGLVPDLRLLTAPAKSFTPFLDAVAPQFRRFWSGLIVAQQRDVMITAAATAVGINMTFLLPYSMLKRGWDRDFRGLAIFDLSTGLFLPFILATGCVVIASATQFHTRPAVGLLGERDGSGKPIEPASGAKGQFDRLIDARIRQAVGAEAFAQLTPAEKQARIDALPQADRRMAAMLVQRDAFDLAGSLSPLTGRVFGHYVFGIGVVGMAVSSIIILMLINGFVVCEMLGRPSRGWPYRLACLAPGVTGFLGPFIWGGRTKFWLAVPTSVFCMVLLPIAYFTFALVMNQKSLLGENMPRGLKRLVWNVLMLVAAGLAAFGSVWSLWSKTKWYGIAAITAFVSLAVVVHFVRKNKAAAA